MPSTLWRSLVWAAKACLLCSLFHLCFIFANKSMYVVSCIWLESSRIPGRCLCEVHTMLVHCWYIHFSVRLIRLVHEFMLRADSFMYAPLIHPHRLRLGRYFSNCVVTEWWVSCNRLNSDPLSSWQVWSSQQFFSSNLKCQLLSVSQYGIHLGMTSRRNQAGHCFPSTACRILFLIDYDCLVESSMLCISVGHLRLSGVRVEGLTLCFILI